MTQSRSIFLRAVEPSDADFMYEVENDSSSWKYGDTVAPLSRNILRDYALKYDADPFSARQLRLIIAEKSPVAGRELGIVDLYEINPVHRRAFIGIYVLPSFRNEGIASQALIMMENYARKILNLRLLAAKVESVNSISLALFKHCGYKVTAVIPEWFSYADSPLSDLSILTKKLS